MASRVEPEAARQRRAAGSDGGGGGGSGCCGCFGSSSSSGYAKVALEEHGGGGEGSVQGGGGGAAAGGADESDGGGGEAVVLQSAGNIGIPSSYFLVGFGPALLGTPLSVYMVKTLNASPAQQNTIGILMTLPWTFKVVYGFISDAYPIWGMRRKPYFLIGWAINVGSFAALALLGAPTLQQLSALLLLGTFGSIMADVMTDTMIVERAKSEPAATRGTFQSTCYSVRFMGSVLGSTAGAVLYNKASWGWGASFATINWIIVAMTLLVLAATAPRLADRRDVVVKPVQEQMALLWATVRLRAVWVPMCFIYFYNATQVRAAAAAAAAALAAAALFLVVLISHLHAVLLLLLLLLLLRLSASTTPPRSWATSPGPRSCRTRSASRASNSARSPSPPTS